MDENNRLGEEKKPSKARRRRFDLPHRPSPRVLQRVGDGLRERERKIWDLRTREGKTHQQIADLLHLDRTTVTKALKRINVRIREEIDDQAVNVKQEQIENLQFITAEALEAWERSKMPSKSVSQRKTNSRRRGTGGGQDEEVTIRVEEPVGDSRFLNTAMAAMGDVRKLLGLDSPTKIATTDTQGNGLVQMSDEERNRRLIALMGAAQQRAKEQPVLDNPE